MNEIVISILDKFLQNGIEVNEQMAYQIIEMTLANYNIVPKSTELAIASDLPKHAANFIGCKKYMDGLAQGTIKNYTSTLRELCSYIGKNANDIDVNDLRGFIFEKYQELAPTTMCTKIWNIKSFFSWMHKEGIIARNEASKLVTPKVPDNLREYQSTEEIELCREVCDNDRKRAMYEFFLSTGCRVSEAVKLKIKDVLEQDFIVFGKGSKERHCYVNDKAKLYIKKYIKHRKGDSEYLFISQYSPYQPIKVRAMQREMNNIGKAAKLHLFPHLCRHTMATHTLKNGARLKEVQEMLGHSTSATTEVYAKMDNRNIKIAHQKYAVI